MRAAALVAIGIAALAGCKPRHDMEDQCHDVVEHMRQVTMMPMRPGDVGMFMGACEMWKPSTIDCMLAATNDRDLGMCHDLEPAPAAAPAAAAAPSYLDSSKRDDVRSGGSRMIPIQTASGTFHVWTKRTGNNPTIKVLLLHGGPGATSEYFAAFDSYFPGASVEYYVYDQLESGNSDHPDKPELWTIPHYVDEVEQVRQALHLDHDNFYLLGHSWGGIVAIEYALAHQDHLKGLVISNMMSSIPAYNAYAHDVLMPAMEPKALAEILALEKAKQYDKPRYEELLLPFYTEHILRMPAEAWPDPVVRAFAHLNKKIYVALQGPSEMGATGVLEHWDRTADLEKITVPTLVIGAQHDTMDPKFMEAMAKKIKRGRYLYCPNGSHLAMYDDQETYMAGVIAFLRDVDAGAIRPSP